MPAARIGELIEFFLGLLVTAGDYALAIQPRVGGPAQKDGHNAWVSALTDAVRRLMRRRRLTEDSVVADFEKARTTRRRR